MKFIVSWTLPQATFPAAVKRFLETGGAPPANVKMIGRWHGTSMNGFAIAETNDAKAIYSWVAAWADVIAIQITPCLEDAEAGEVLQKLKF